MSESNNANFSNKTIFLFHLCIIFCAVFFIGSILFLFQNIQDLLIDFGDKVLGRALDRQNWYIVISQRAKYSSVFSLLLGLAFYLLSIVNFSNTSEANISFLPEKNLLHDKKFIITLIFLFTILSSLRFFWISQKKTFHIDEIYEFGIINRNEHGFWHGDFFKTNKKYTGKEIKEEAFFNDSSLKDSISDIIHLYLHCNDNPHTGLYYILQRLAFTGRKTFDFKEIVYRSFLVNLIISAFSFYFMFLLLSKIFKHKYLIILILLAAFGNPNTIGNCLFFRPFILQELNLIIFANIFSFYYLALENNQSYKTKKNFILSSVCLGFALVSEYFSLFFVGFFGLIILYMCIKNKKIEDILYFITMFFAGIIVAKIIYPDYGIGFFDDRASYSMLENFITAIKSSIFIIDKYFMFFYLFASIFFCNFIVSTIFRIRKNNTFMGLHFSIISVTLLFILIANYFAPFKYEARYTAPVFIYLPLIFIPFIQIQNSIITSILRIIHVILVFVIIYSSLPFGYNTKNIPHLDDAEKTISEVQYNKDSSIPVIITIPFAEWAVYPYLNDDQIYFFSENAEDFNEITKDLKTFWSITYVDHPDRRYINECLIEKK